MKARLANAEVHRNANLMKDFLRVLRANVAKRREMKKDAITRQVIDEEVGEDEFFTVQVKL